MSPGGDGLRPLALLVTLASCLALVGPGAASVTYNLDGASVVSPGAWTNAGDALLSDGTSATASADGAAMRLQLSPVSIPSGTTIVYVGLSMRGYQASPGEDNDLFLVQVHPGSNPTVPGLYDYTAATPTDYDADLTSSRSWTAADFSDIEVSVTAVKAGSVVDGDWFVDSVSVFVLVNRPPTATPGSASATEDTPITLVLSGSDPDLDPLTFALPSATTAMGGALSVPDPSKPWAVRYTPAPNFNGADSFAFTVSDGDATVPGTFSLSVAAVDDAVATIAVAPAVQNLVRVAASNATQTFTATAQDAAATPVPLDSATQVVWSISSPAGGSFAANVLSVGTTAGAYTVTARFNATIAATTAFTIQNAPAHHIEFSTIPAGCWADVPCTTQPVARAVDAFGNLDAAFPATLVTIGVLPHTPAVAATGGSTATTSGGIATFSGFMLDRSGSAIGLSPTAPGVSCSCPVTAAVDVHGIERYAFTQAPGLSNPGVAFNPTVKFAALREDGTPEPLANGTVTLSFGHDAGPQARLTGAATRTFSGGIANFTGLAIDRVGYGYTLIASGQGFPVTGSPAFDVVPRTAAWTDVATSATATSSASSSASSSAGSSSSGSSGSSSSSSGSSSTGGTSPATSGSGGTTGTPGTTGLTDTRNRIVDSATGAASQGASGSPGVANPEPQGWLAGVKANALPLGIGFAVLVVAVFAIVLLRRRM